MENRLKSYQDFCISVALYNRERDAVIYPILGIVNEFGEFLEKYYTVVHGDILDRFKYTKEDLIAEAGDVTWYLAMTYADMGLELPVIPEYLFTGQVSNSLDIKTFFFQLCEICGKWKKVLRDRNGIPNSADDEYIKERLNYGWCVMANVARKLGSSLQEVLEYNEKKLSKRKENNCLRGDGDKRGE